MKNLITIIILLTFTLPIYPQTTVQKYLIGANITSIVVDNDKLWVSTYGEGIYYYSFENKKWTNFSTKNNNLNNDFFYTLAVGKQEVWAGTTDGLFIYSKRKKTWTKRKFAKGGELGNWIRTLCYDNYNDILWIGRFKNLTLYDARRRKYEDFDLTKKNDTKTNNIKTIEVDGDSLVWFGTEAGVHIYNKKLDIHNSDAWSFIGNDGSSFNGDGEAVSISDILFDDKNVWFATDEFVTSDQPKFNVGGIYKFDRKFIWDRISKREGLIDDGVYTLALTGNKIWAGVYSFYTKEKKELGKGLFLIDKNTKEIKRLEFDNIDLFNTKVNELLFDGKIMWIGTDSGLLALTLDNPLAHISKK
ncbi:MAG: hypothetical protein COW08_06615 [Ignavibacteriales bacterium CG12_big_fil_rev_8_21_14_0_65_30_8]|nr:MAG: hypothetical protein COW08_06615 [Ignavibacteriales bacterium CG12_big_fil_rev_8_21_14_0_65_30_8]